MMPKTIAELSGALPRVGWTPEVSEFGRVSWTREHDEGMVRLEVRAVKNGLAASLTVTHEGQDDDEGAYDGPFAGVRLLLETGTNHAEGPVPIRMPEEQVVADIWKWAGLVALRPK